jgi:CheY-like chemotaxis protein
MPGMTGIDIATKLFAINIEIPVVLCTADHELIARQSKPSLNIRHSISKPIDIRELTDLISSIVA